MPNVKREMLLSGIPQVTSRGEPMQTMRALERAVSVLEYLAQQEGPVGPSQISRATGLSKAVIVRVLRSWEALGYVSSREGAYELGWRLFTLAAGRGDAQSLGIAARRHLQYLNEQSNETVHLAVFDNHEMVYVDKIEGRQAIRVYTGIGWRGPLHATASGKAFLASASDEFVSSVAQASLPRLTDQTLTSSAALYEDLQSSRERGFSINKGEWHQEVGGVGAAILSRHAEPEGALSITFPVATTDAARIEVLGGMVHAAARQLSKERGYVERSESVQNLTP